MKEEILETSLKQFLKYGIREMSIQKLVAPLGISTKTVYKYFENKEKLLEAALRLYYKQQSGILETFNTSKSAVCVLFDIWYMGIEGECRVNKVFFKDLHYYYPELEKKVESTISKKLWKRFNEIIEDGIREGFFREGIHPDIALEAISAVYVSIARTTKFKRFRRTQLDIYLNTITVFIRGCCTPKGVEELGRHIEAITTSGKIKVSELIDAANN